MEAVELTTTTLHTFDIGKTFKASSEITSLSFSNDGQLLLSTSDTICLHNVLKGTHENTILSPSSYAQFANHPSAFLSCSPQSIDYWNLNSSRIIHSFPFSSSAFIDMSPSSDTLLASGQRQVQLLELNTKKAVATMELKESMGNIVCKHDPLGLVFIIAYSIIENGRYKIIVQMFDAREFTKGPVNVWEYDGSEVINIDFSFDGQYFILNTKSNVVMIIDALSGQLKNVFKEYSGNGVCPAVMSPDSKFLFAACERNFGVVVADVENCSRIHEIRGNVRSIKCLAWSPEHCVFATANDYLSLWVPNYLKLR